MEIDIILLALIGYILGGVGRTVFDYLLKVVKNDDFEFDAKYAASMIISIILTLITATFTFPVTQSFGIEPLPILLSSGAQGFAINHIVNGVIGVVKPNTPTDTQ